MTSPLFGQRLRSASSVVLTVIVSPHTGDAATAGPTPVLSRIATATAKSRKHQYGPLPANRLTLQTSSACHTDALRGVAVARGAVACGIGDAGGGADPQVAVVVRAVAQQDGGGAPDVDAVVGGAVDAVGLDARVDDRIVRL